LGFLRQSGAAPAWVRVLQRARAASSGLSTSTSGLFLQLLILDLTARYHLYAFHVGDALGLGRFKGWQHLVHGQRKDGTVQSNPRSKAEGKVHWCW
jgi:hypothetical protein